ncbi:DUF2142 domain-containing protein [Gulosibacter sp. ACHW.36C]|uniref:DUF2142 domain-containing protein n=1 Tax=Gulosibacter sediminis TaxID=1729695 RepID=A0ABY4MVE8_9MICO|nr:DUF2142 domain-containing protein [Gulosibacter sediminis]UQN14406.1 DUF2142 domain-containing protein [Gulosibacter sediminis]
MFEPPAHHRQGVHEDTNGNRLYSLAIATTSLLFFAFSLLWAFNSPFFDGPDESRHINSISRLVDGGGWPMPYEAVVTGATHQAELEGSVVVTQDGAVRELLDPIYRSTLFEYGTSQDKGRDTMLQHPPGYYAVAATVVAALGGGELRWDHAQFIVRGVSAAIVAGAIPFIVGTVRRVTRSRLIGILGGVGLLCVPFFTGLGGYASNDTLLLLACSATMYLLVRGVREARPSAWLLPLAGVAYGVALFTKGFALMLAPTVVILAFWVAWRRRRSVLHFVVQLLVPAAIAFAIGGWWWARNLLLLGKIQPSQLGDRERHENAFSGYDFGRFVGAFFERLNGTFWGRNLLPAEVVTIAGVALIFVLIVALLTRQTRSMFFITALFPLLIAATIFNNAHGIYWDTSDPSRGVQGRYLFGGIVAVAIAIGACWLLILRRASTRARSILTMVGVAAPVAITAVCLPFMVSRRWTMFWQTNGIVMETATWQTNAQHHLALPSWVDALVILLATVTAIATAVLAARLSTTKELFDDAPAATNEQDGANKKDGAAEQAAPSVIA